jgi:lipooligosaccharide transport system ATP-binding protein
MSALQQKRPASSPPRAGDIAIEATELTKAYGKGDKAVHALTGVSFSVPSGTVFGLLGPNGAGKSTTMRLLTAQSIAAEGEIEVLGYRLPEESKIARADGKAALDNYNLSGDTEEDLKYLKTYCGPVFKAIDLICRWVEEKAGVSVNGKKN